jgi:hypothetical protein
VQGLPTVDTFTSGEATHYHLRFLSCPFANMVLRKDISNTTPIVKLMIPHLFHQPSSELLGLDTSKQVSQLQLDTLPQIPAFQSLPKQPFLSLVTTGNPHSAKISEHFHFPQPCSLPRACYLPTWPLPVSAQCLDV